MKNRFFIFTLLLLPAAAMAELYKWTDANGHVQFSDQAPAHNTKTEKLAVPTALPPSGRTNNDATESANTSETMIQRQKKMSDILKAEREQREADTARIAEEKAQKKRKCLSLKDYQKRSEGGVLYDLDDNGERRFIGEKATQQHREKLNNAVQEACQP